MAKTKYVDQGNEIAFVMPVADFLHVAPFVGKEDERHYLNGIFIEPCEGGALAVSTDGHRLGVYRSAEAICNKSAAWRVPPSLNGNTLHSQDWVVGTIDASENARLHIVLCQGSAQDAIADLDHASIVYGDATCAPGREYPNWRTALPKPTKEEPHVIAFNGEYLASFGKYATLHGTGQDAPHVVQTKDPNFLGVIMPMRPNDQKHDVLEFIAKQEQANG